MNPKTNHVVWVITMLSINGGSQTYHCGQMSTVGEDCVCESTEYMGTVNSFKFAMNLKQLLKNKAYLRKLKSQRNFSYLVVSM